MAPIVIIGAARSGTKLLRDTLALHPQIACVPYDVNFVWLLGNEHFDHDELEPEHASTRSSRRIRRYIEGHARGRQHVVEKTVGNALRVGFVDSVLPDCRFVHLIRDGRDVVASACAQWQAPVDLRYAAGKALRYPIGLAPGYAARYVLRQLEARTGRAVRPAVWGPRYRGIYEDVRSRPLLEVCALQWVRCIERSLDGLAGIPPERVCTIRYEDLVAAPAQQLASIAQFMAVDPEPFADLAFERIIRGGLAGSYRSRLRLQDIETMNGMLADTLTRLNYHAVEVLEHE